MYWAQRRFHASGRISIAPRCTFVGTDRIHLIGDMSIDEGGYFSTDGGGRINIGDDVAFNRNVHINASIGGTIDIGPGCLIGPNVVMRTAGHRFDDLNVAIRAQGHNVGDIIIGANTWIGANATILGGVTLGDGVVVGAGAVVTRNVPSGSVVVGAPARRIRNRGDHE